MARGAHGALGMGYWGTLTRALHKLWRDTGHFIFEQKNQGQDLLTANPLKEIPYNCLLWPVSVREIYRAYPERFVNSLRPGDILKSMHSKLSSSSMYVMTCIEMRHKGAYWWEVNIESGNGLAASDNKPLLGPLLTRFMTPCRVTIPQMSSVYILHCRH